MIKINNQEFFVARLMDLLCNRFRATIHHSMLRNTACNIYFSTNENLANYDMHLNENITDQTPAQVPNHKTRDFFTHHTEDILPKTTPIPPPIYLPDMIIKC